jgi:hypothetical protein
VAEPRDPYPSLPPREYTLSRLLRLLVFSFVVSTLFVSAFVVAFRWVWDEFLAGVFDRAYQVRIELLLPAILVITVVVALRLWDASKGPRLRTGGAA